MSWANVRLIFFREVRDQVRDRRTLFMIVVLPILLYPALGIGLVQLTVLFTEAPRKVMIVGEQYLPDHPPLVQGDRFAPELFEHEADAELLVVESRDELDLEALRRGQVQVIVEVPADMKEQLAAGKQVQPTVHRNSADERSNLTQLRVMELLAKWKDQILAERLSRAGLSAAFADPVTPKREDVASPEQSAGTLWGKLFPFLLVVMSLTGAFYPAVDLCAGEKERGTMETLLISPAARSEIVLGKYLTIMLFSMATAVLNLLSMGLTGWHLSSLLQAPVGNSEKVVAILTPPTLLSVVWIVILLVPLAAFFSALCLSLAAFARSTKEGQYYLMPLYLVTLPLVFLTLAPGIELSPFYSLVPITGVALLLKALLQAQWSTAEVYFLPVLVPTLLYSFLALRWAIDQFNREDVLFREAERLDLGLWVRHLIRDKQDTPSGGEALACFVIMLGLVWFSTAFIRGQDPRDVVKLIVIPQLAFVAAPPLFMSLFLARSVRKTLLLQLPRWNLLAVGLILAVAVHPLAVELDRLVQQELPLPPRVKEVLEELLGAGRGLGWQIMLVAALPAVCEELAFRGFILSGLLRGHSAGRAIAISAVLFGLFHLNPQQFFNATLLGLVIGLLATRSASLLPGALFHFANNALAVLAGRIGEQALRRFPELTWLVRDPGSGATEGLRYQPWVITVSAAAVFVLVAYLVTRSVRVSEGGAELRPAMA